jgi:hypothetical protein
MRPEKEPAELAKQLNLLIECAVVSAHAERDMNAAQRGKK